LNEADAVCRISFCWLRRRQSGCWPWRPWSDPDTAVRSRRKLDQGV